MNDKKKKERLLNDSEIKVLANDYIKDEDSTVRTLAIKYKISKSTVDKYLYELLPKIDFELSEKVSFNLKLKKKRGQQKGGYATKMKYKGKEKV